MMCPPSSQARARGPLGSGLRREPLAAALLASRLGGTGTAEQSRAGQARPGQGTVERSKPVHPAAPPAPSASPASPAELNELLAQGVNAHDQEAVVARLTPDSYEVRGDEGRWAAEGWIAESVL